MDLRRFSRLPLIGAIAVVYFLAGKLGLHLAFVHANASPVWPATGIALASMLVFGYRVWPGIFVAAFLVNATTAGNIFTSLGIAAGNTLEAVCGAWLVNRFAGGTSAFDRYQHVFRFASAILFGTMVSPSIGVTCLTMAGFAAWANYPAIWVTWWLGDFSGAIIFTPVLMLWMRNPRRHLNPARDREVAILLAVLLFLSSVVFGGWLALSRSNYPVAFLLGPIIVWTAFRLSQRETASGIFLLTVIAMWGTLRGFGPFVRSTPNEALLILQSFNVVTTITALALAAGMAERRRAMSSIEQQKLEVEAANRTKDNFLAMLSHELRTPLTPVIAALDGLESAGPQTEETKSAVAMIRRNVELESQLIDDLLDLTRIARDKLQLHFAPIDAHQAIANVIEMCRNEAAVGKLSVHANLRAGAHFISADAAKFQQIVWNILKNAIKFTKPGGDINVSTINPTPQVLEISVRDSGIGMEPDVIKRIFDPFEQGDRSFQTRFGGLGLGLAISKSLAEAHNGILVARSEGRDQGSTFVLTMNTVSPTYQWAAPQPSAPQAQSLRILLVDDHIDTCTALERLLVRRGHLVATAHDIRSAMETAARSQFDLLISDIALPDGSGTELISCLRALKPIRGIAISGFGMNGDIEKSLKAGFSAHLVKPIKVEKLEAAIDRVMAQ
ncbi:MAG TPA: MASE1 domain-containing protein [Chthoniobacterales bacterium]|nr:MASE1 domain-containing protein [Chthoniobacterales bacterium]